MNLNQHVPLSILQVVSNWELGCHCQPTLWTIERNLSVSHACAGGDAFENHKVILSKNSREKVHFFCFVSNLFILEML